MLVKILQKNFKKDILNLNELSSATEIIIWECKNYDLPEILSHCKNLKRLRISEWNYPDLTLLSAAPNLQQLEIIGVEKDLSLAGIEKMTSLKHIEIITPPHWKKSHTVKFTNYKLVYGLRKLSKLELIGCELEDYSDEELMQKCSAKNFRIVLAKASLVVKDGVINTKGTKVTYLDGTSEYIK